jgi:hypothetical protein
MVSILYLFTTSNTFSGSVGQIGSELTMRLREIYGNSNVVAGYRKTQPSEELANSGPLNR